MLKSKKKKRKKKEKRKKRKPRFAQTTNNRYKLVMTDEKKGDKNKKVMELKVN